MPAMSGRAILHVDMDAFFAAVEQRDDPALRGQPVLIGGRGPRSVVATASYEARAFGCRSAMPMSRALRLCPKAIVVPPRGAAYGEASRQVFELFREITPLVEPLSVDEAFLDVTASRRSLGPATRIAETLRCAIRETVGLTASVGVAPNKFIAKLASERDKPDGLTVVRPAQVEAFLAGLSVRAIPGVGPKTQARLEAVGIRTTDDVRAWGRDRLVARLGEFGQTLHDRAMGIDDRPVVPDHEAKSIGQECTFGEDVEDPEEVTGVLRAHAEEVASRLRRHGLLAGTMAVKIRFGDFQTITRSRRITPPTHRTDRLVEVAVSLFEQWTQEGFEPVRLIGATAAGLAKPDAQGLLFEDPDDVKATRLDEAVDLIRDRFGRGAIQRGPRGSLTPPPLRDGRLSGGSS